MSINPDSARKLLETTFAQAESDLLRGAPPEVDAPIAEGIDALFVSGTQAYREVLLGCMLARIEDRSIDIRLPYVGQGERAFSGRTLDEKVVNPFLKDKQIPSSRGPYLGVFRRNVRFDQATKQGLRDRPGYDALLAVLSYVESLETNEDLSFLLRYLLYRFAKLREESTVPLARVQRLSLRQYAALFDRLLGTPSGGRFPVLLVVACLKAIQEHFGLKWAIEYQGINVADKASGDVGDITIRLNDTVVLAAEVTERIVERSRVVSTFASKIAPAGVLDYLFYVTNDARDPQAIQQAEVYFSQGHEVNFVDVASWLVMNLTTIGAKGRCLFLRLFLDLLDAAEIPRSMKAAWNEQINKITQLS